ncbi:MAG: chloride channel protein [Pseudanabaenaceae cyanobacterium]
MRASPQLVKLLNRLQPPAETVLLVLAIGVGLATGTGILLFRKLILLAQELYWHDLAVQLRAVHPWLLALIPILGGGLVALLRLPLDRAPSTSRRIQAIAKQLGLLPYQEMPVKTTAAALSLACGASLGPEGPSVELGRNVGSYFGQLLRFSSERTRLLVGAGGAAGLAAGFNAPIAAVFFALEVLLRDALGKSQLSLNADIGVVVIASVVSALVAQLGLGAEPAFHLPVYEVRSYWELPLYMGLGALASLVAIVFTKSLGWAQSWLDQWLVPQWVKLLLGGAVVGVVALFLPEVTGIGYETIEGILQNNPFSLKLLVFLLVMKLVLTPLCLSCGFVGGIFAPALFFGAVLGGIYGSLLDTFAPAIVPVAAPPAYALVGMAAVLAGTVRAPLTSVLLLFEMTRDYRIVLPLMSAVGLCAWLIAQMQLPKAQIFNWGMQLNDNTEDYAVLEQIKVADVMTLNPPTVRQSLSLLQAAQVLTSGYHHSVMVVDENGCLVGILTNQDIKRLLANPAFCDRLAEISVASACTSDVLHTYADESVVDALKRMAVRDLRQLPVVDRQFHKKVVGLVDKLVIATAYESALAKVAIADQTNRLRVHA